MHSQTELWAKPELARRADSFVDSIGVNVHLTYLDTAYKNYSDIVKPRLQELKIRHIRDGGFYSKAYFHKLQDLARLGIKSTLTFFGTPPNEVIGIAKTLKGEIEAVEGPNESDLKQFNFSYKGQRFPEGTRLYQKDLYTAIKSNPKTKDLPVLLPSMGWGENAQKLRYLKWGDIGNLHSYPYQGEKPTYDIDRYFIPHGRKIAGERKPLMVTETGYHNLRSDASGISELAASKYLTRLLFENFNRNIKRTYLYELIDQQSDLQQPDAENHYGLLRHDGSPKPAYTAIKNLITLLKEPGANFQPDSLDYKLDGNLNKVHHSLLQASNGNFYLVVWQDAKSWSNQNKKDIKIANRNITLSLNTVINQASVYAPAKSIMPINRFTNRNQLNQIPLSVPDYPLVIKLVRS